VERVKSGSTPLTAWHHRRMTIIEKAIVCSRCNAPLSGDGPCPACGSPDRAIHVTATTGIAVTEDVVARGTSASKLTKSTTELEVRVRHTVTRNTGRLSVESRRIDRRANTYDKVIHDAETGEVVYEQHEPLTAHVGRGDARRPR
jgi:hypothetical protein